MSVYRDEPCGFCGMQAHEHCPRCQVPVCTTHAPAGGAPHCTVCAKELTDDLDLVRFAVDVWQERKTRRRFARRTLEDIAEWRRRAGVRVRSGS